MLAGAAQAIAMCRESAAETEARDREETRVLLALASAFEAEHKRDVACGEVPDQALARRTQSVLLRRRSSEDMTERVVTPPAEASPMEPPARFVRRQRWARPGTPRAEPEPRGTLVVSSLYPSFRTTVPPVRTVRWGRKRKPEVTWDDGPKTAVGPGARARALAGSVAYT